MKKAYEATESVEEFNRNAHVNENGSIYLFVLDPINSGDILAIAKEKHDEGYENRRKNGVYTRTDLPDVGRIPINPYGGFAENLEDVTIFYNFNMGSGSLHGKLKSGYLRFLPAKIRSFLTGYIEDEIMKTFVKVSDHEEFHRIMSCQKEITDFVDDSSANIDGSSHGDVHHRIYKIAKK